MLVFSDLHLGLSSDNIAPNGEIPTKCQDAFNRAVEIVDLAAKRSELLVFAGDMSDSVNPKSYVHTLIVRLMKYAEDKGVRFIIISGNHDNDSVWSALEPVLHVCEGKRINIVLHNPMLLEVDDKEVLFFPHFSKSKLQEIGSPRDLCKKLFGKDSFDILITHAQTCNSSLTSETQSLESGNAMLYEKGFFPDFKLGIFGHEHRHSVIRDKKGKQEIVNCGSVIVNDFGEVNDVKGYVIVKDLSWKFEEFKTPVTEYGELNVNLLTQTDFEVTKEIKSKLTGKLVKVIVDSDSIAKVDEVRIRKLLTPFCTVVRFEKRIIENAVSVMDEIEEEVLYEQLNYSGLFKHWLGGQEGVTERVKKSAMRICKEITANVN
jgi:DNA repair exonuclease SbcCD nuclease subunit